jgi:hypothetical protein
VLFLDVESQHAVQHPVPGFRHQRVREPEVGLDGGVIMMLGHPGERGVAHHHAEGVGDQDGGLQETGLLHPGRPGHLSVAVERVPPGEHRIEAAPSREDRGDAAARRPLAHPERSLPLDDRGRTHLDMSSPGGEAPRVRVGDGSQG